MTAREEWERAYPLGCAASWPVPLGAYDLDRMDRDAADENAGDGRGAE